MAHEMTLQDIAFRLQVPTPIEYKGLRLDCAYKADVVVQERVIVELKSVEALTTLHHAQLLTYMKVSRAESKRSGNPSFVSALKLRISCLGNQRTRRGEHGSTADGALPGTGGGISGIGPEGEHVGRSQWRAAARAGELVRPFAALAGAA